MACPDNPAPNTHLPCGTCGRTGCTIPNGMCGIGCDRCAADRLGGFTYSTEAHSLTCPAALVPAATLVRDVRNGCGPLRDLTFSDLCDLVATFAPYNEASRERFLSQIAQRVEEAFTSDYVAEVVRRHRREEVRRQTPVVLESEQFNDMIRDATLGNDSPWV
jgi:hypothetical protein